MGARLSDRQNQALAVLAIATAAIGFGLFGADWELQSTGELNTEIGAIYYWDAAGGYSGLDRLLLCGSLGCRQDFAARGCRQRPGTGSGAGVVNGGGDAMPGMAVSDQGILVTIVNDTLLA